MDLADHQRDSLQRKLTRLPRERATKDPTTARARTSGAASLNESRIDDMIFYFVYGNGETMILQRE